MRRARFVPGLVALAGVASLVLTASAQTATVRWDVPAPASLPSWMAVDLVDNGEDELAEYGRRSMQRKKELTRELQLLRRDYFRATRNVERRQLGISKLREYATPENFPVLLEVFRREHPEVRQAMLDLFVDQATDEADTALAWAAIFESSGDLRKEALERLKQRVDQTGGKASERIVYVVAQGIKRRDQRVRGHAAGVADALNITQVIPHLIAAQGGARSTLPEATGDRAWIMIGKQRAFVSDLQPVVADSAVAFDPQLSVVTEGVLLRVGDSSVVTYHTDIHSALVGLASRAWGEDLSGFGYDQPRWAKWYVQEFLPAQEAKAKAAEALAEMQPVPDQGDPAAPAQGDDGVDGKNDSGG